VCADPAAGFGQVISQNRTIKLAGRASGVSLTSLDLTSGGDQFWAIFMLDAPSGSPNAASHKLYQQRFAFDGTPAESQPNQLVVASAKSEIPIDWVTVGVMALLLVVILNTLVRRRAAMRDEEDREE